ncbi:hypothetical protein KP509_08G057600 [Ceratopteris richardii]|uniref:CBS domain-containing protein n=1 Tax=Ceratopteris richardii TaxID=49495 RepID=A0A8T2UAS5_CERRI|nr:hypothetical protein KP509_08G057600 [Ceratopteris richardii]
MALALLSHVVADLTLGKPALPWLPSTASVRDAIAALKQLDDVSELSIWGCSTKACSPDLSFIGSVSPASAPGGHRNCLCIGKICMQRVICYLASEKTIIDLQGALNAPVTDLLEHFPPKTVIQHVDPDASLREALDLIVKGAQNLVVPITRRGGHEDRRSLTPKSRISTVSSSIQIPKDHGGQEYCWLTPEDVLRFLLGSISVFSPLPMTSIEDLGLIRTDVRTVKAEEDAYSALEMIKEACHYLSAVGIIDANEADSASSQLIGDISCSMLQTCNEMASLALMVLSAGDFLAFAQDCRNPPQVLVEMIRTRLREKLGLLKDSLNADRGMEKPWSANFLLRKLDMWEESSSEDDESGADSPSGPHDLLHKWHSFHLRSSRKSFTVRSRSGPIFCNPRSSLVAVLLQALAHREHYVWVTEEDDSLLGIVTFRDIITVMFNHINVFT